MNRHKEREKDSEVKTSGLCKKNLMICFLQSAEHGTFWEKIIIMVFGCSLLLFSQSLTEYSDPMKQDKIHSLHQAPSFRVRNCVVWGRGWEGTVCSGGEDTLCATSPAR